MQLNRSHDCGNSPKNKKVENIAIAIETHDLQFLNSILHSEIEWKNTESVMTNIEDIVEWHAMQSKPSSITIKRVMSHGKVGAVNGVALSGKIETSFCHVIEFATVKCDQVVKIESYRN